MYIIFFSILCNLLVPDVRIYVLLFVEYDLSLDTNLFNKKWIIISTFKKFKIFTNCQKIFIYRKHNISKKKYIHYWTFRKNNILATYLSL